MLSDRILVVVTAVVALLYLWGAERIPHVAIGDPLGPSAFPLLLGGLLLIGAALLAWEIRGKTQSSTEPWISRHALQSTTGIVVWIALYLLAYDPLGYVISTAAFLLGLTFWFNRGRWIQNLALSVGLSVCAYYVFSKLLNGNLPQGVLPV